MHLTIRERERIELFQIAEFARRRVDRGSRLSAPEAIALVCDELLEMAWDGAPLEEVVAAAYKVLEPERLLPGVASLVPHIQVEALFPQGTALIAVDWPFGSPEPTDPGGLQLADDPIVINAGRPVQELAVTNTSDRPVFVSSHFPFVEVNSSLVFDRAAAAGTRLNIPAGTSDTFEPGQTRTVGLIPINRSSTRAADRP